MKRIILISLTVVFMCCLMQCVKDKTILNQNLIVGCTQTDSFLIRVADTLFDFPPCGQPFGGQYIFHRKHQYYKPCFNPSNPNEIVYGRRDMSASNSASEIRVFNLCTGEDRLICANGFASPNMQWSKTGWIVFTGSDGQIWKVRDNGSELTRLTNEGFNIEPIWSPDYSKILFDRTANQTHYKILIDVSGVALDTFPSLISATSWLWTFQDKLTTVTANTSTGYGVGYYDFIKDSFIEFKAIDLSANNGYHFTNCPIIQSTAWFQNNRSIIYSGLCMISITDTLTGQTTEIRQGADNAHFGPLSVSPDEQKIVFERYDRFYGDTFGNSCLLNVEYNIYLINKDGSDLRRIKFPE